jgi:hypothetical protein
MRWGSVVAGVLTVGVWISPLRADVTQLSGDGIVQRLVGNSVTWSEDGDCFVEYYGGDGAVAGRKSGETYSAKWRIDGDFMCFDYGPGSANVCWSLMKSGEDVYWLPLSGDAALKTKLVQGEDPKLCTQAGQGQ